MLNTRVKLARNFFLEEFLADNDPLRKKNPRAYEAYVLKYLPNLKRIASVLQQIRDHFRADSVTIHDHGGLRPPELNEIAKGEDGSRHLYGEAADIKVYKDGKQIPPSQVYEYAKSLADVGGVGLYSTFTHVDVRPRKPGALPAMWRG